ncbi:MAG: DNA replication protein DnaC [Ruminococcaceae bacterium]|nr:DNA replication protein DnaC [Oscillospiraceae bacterium]
MAYSRENVARIRAEYENRRREAAAKSERRKDELYRQIPSLLQIDHQLSSVGASVLKLALEGGDLEAGVAQMKKEHNALRARRAEILTAAGYPADYTNIHYRCEACLDTGFIGTKMCACMRRELVLAGYESSGLGHLLAQQSFDTFSMQYYTGADRAAMEVNVRSLRDFASQFSQRREENWLLIGATGLGKTHLSTSVAKEVIDAGFDVIYDTAQGIFSAFEKAQFGRGEGDGSAAERYFQCDLLILDDLGTELTNSFTISCLYNLINTRLNSRRSTLINTNLSYAELRSRYADRITSRLFGEFHLLSFTGKDVRVQKLKQ